MFFNNEIEQAMEYKGKLVKMRTEWANPVNYYLQLGDNEIELNKLIGHQIAMSFSGVINCIHCGKATKKSYAQGYCYNCMQTVPEADETVIRPELSMAQFGLAKDMEWAQEHDLIEHYVYLSVTSDLKVGVTRFHQIPTRWIDQGAIQAILLAKTPNRHIAGIIETFLKNYVADKTQWQTMLKEELIPVFSLAEEKNKFGALLPLELQQYLDRESDAMTIVYPGSFSATRIESINLDNQPSIEGKLVKIKGQYLLFEDGKVINIRKHAGYSVVFRVID
jgi:hypothetical protein